MPLLLEDLAEETSASNQRIAERLEQEMRRLEQQRRGPSVGMDLPRQALEAAEQSTDHVTSRVEEAEGIWWMTVKALRKDPLREDAEDLLLSAVKLFESVRGLFPSPKNLWTFAMDVGAEANRLDELKKLEERLEALIGEATGALQHRRAGWQPADPERLALGLQLSRAGKTLKANEARARFRRTTG